MRSIASALVVILAAVSLGGCVLFPPAPDASRDASQKKPSDLVGVWRVTEVAEAGEDTWLRIDGRIATLTQPCGVVEGVWRASADLFVADMSVAYGEGCLGGGSFTPGWLAAASGYAPAESEMALLDASGEQVALLVDDGSEPPDNPYVVGIDAVPTLTPDALAQLDADRVLPEGVTLATDIVGRWVAADETSTSLDEPYVEFSADGLYSASEGCNTTGGRWVLGGDADFLATMGPSTEVGCDMIMIPAWVASAASIGITLGDTDAIFLTLYDKDAQPLGRLVSG